MENVQGCFMLIQSETKRQIFHLFFSSFFFFGVGHFELKYLKKKVRMLDFRKISQRCSSVTSSLGGVKKKRHFKKYFLLFLFRQS